VYYSYVYLSENLIGNVHISFRLCVARIIVDLTYSKSFTKSAQFLNDF